MPPAVVPSPAAARFRLIDYCRRLAEDYSISSLFLRHSSYEIYVLRCNFRRREAPTFYNAAELLVGLSEHATWTQRPRVSYQRTHRLLVDRSDILPVADPPGVGELVPSSLVQHAAVARVDVTVAVQDWMYVSEVTSVRRLRRFMLYEHRCVVRV